MLDQLDYSLTTGFFQSALWKSHNIVQLNTLASHFSVDSDKTSNNLIALCKCAVVQVQKEGLRVRASCASLRCLIILCILV